MVVCKDRLERSRADQRLGAEAAAAVENDIAALLSGKTYDELLSLQRQIQEKLTSGEPVDTDYWESLLKKLLVWKARVRILKYQSQLSPDSISGQTTKSARGRCAKPARAAPQTSTR